MCSSSASASALFVPANTESIVPRRNVSILAPPNWVLHFNNLRPTSPKLRLSASLAERNLEFSWFSPDHKSNNDFNGWAIVETPVQKKKKGLPTFMIGGIGVSLAVLLAVIGYFSLSRKGFTFQLCSPLHGMLNPILVKFDKRKSTDSDESDQNSMVTEASPECEPDSISETVTQVSMEKLVRVIIPIAVDSTQQEALSVLKKLKITEDEVKADELCTRREYARWLVRISSLLERNPRHRIIPSISLSGSLIAAFDDVSVEDPDFESIQALAEAGIVPSKLSIMNVGSDCSKDQGHMHFSPERFISRKDLINWRVQLEYEFPRVDQISRTKVGFMDLKEISSDVSTELFLDMLAGDKSILRKVFGQSKRFQPKKPSTKAQAAVALTSGGMTEVIYTELSRLEAESSSRQAAMEEIRSELLDRGDIQRFWDEKMKREIARGFEVEKDYLAAVDDLEQEKIVQEKSFAELLKEKAAMGCQRQLLLSLKEEVDEMSERLACETATYLVEQHNLKDILRDLETEHEGLLDAKSILTAEKEALRILRSWVEDEARKNQARAKVLEEVGRRWRWDN